MNREFLDRARHTLADLHHHIVRTSRAAAPQADDDITDEPSDLYDAASEERERVIQILLTDRDRAKLSAIDEALARVQDGNYGVCEICDEDIAEGRLELLPFTRLCVTCQAQREREESQHRSRAEHGRRELTVALGSDLDDE